MQDQLAKLNVLVVEDHELQRMAAVQALLSIGVKQLLVAGDGQAALAQLQAHDPIDVVICDLAMPGMDGIQLIRHMAHAQRGKALIISSALEPALIRTVTDMAQAHGLTVLGTLPKPLSLAHLKSLLTHYLDEQLDQDTDDGGDRATLSGVTINRAALERAIAAQQFMLYYQPKVSLTSGQLTAVEALARWLHPTAGLISPEHFIPCLESTQLIGQLTLNLVEVALDQVVTWQNQGRTLTMGINLSPVMLSDTRLPDCLLEKVTARTLRPEQLLLEITESTLIDNAPTALETLARLKMLGFSLAIDDFGTGYSSMQQLNRIPFSELKLDRSFVHGASHDKIQRAIVEANIGLAHNLNMATVAEGVETLADWQLLRHLGCDLAQGFLIGKPMPATALDPWEQHWRSQWPLD